MHFGSPSIRLMIAGTVLTAALGCVSQTEYRAQVSEKDALAERLKQEEERAKQEEARAAALAQQQQELETRLKATESEAEAAREAGLKAQRELEERTQAQKDLIGSLQKEIDEGNIKISQVKDQLSMQIVDKILFPSGSDEIGPEGKGVLKKVSDALKAIKRNRIRIEGHTDNVPIGPKLASKFPSNWELSTARASRVVRYLEELGVNPAKMSAVGMSQYRPIASNKTPEGRQQNRRIEVILFPEDIQSIIKELE